MLLLAALLLPAVPSLAAVWLAGRFLAVVLEGAVAAAARQEVEGTVVRKVPALPPAAVDAADLAAAAVLVCLLASLVAAAVVAAVVGTAGAGAHGQLLHVLHGWVWRVLLQPCGPLVQHVLHDQRGSPHPLPCRCLGGSGQLGQG